jgi:hypothetical protein
MRVEIGFIGTKRRVPTADDWRVFEPVKGSIKAEIPSFFGFTFCNDYEEQAIAYLKNKGIINPKIDVRRI